MKANASPMSVADYCNAYNSGRIIVNEEYQRRHSLWSNQAKSFFIESILLEYPVPKFYLYARLDLKSRETIKEIVDGQQRSQSLAMFFNNKLRLSTIVETEELRGKKYSQIDDLWQTRFLGYSLPIDQFQGVPDSEVREAFRRMNANNVPLNDEEQRNARYQGPFKWFVVSIAEQFKDALFTVGLFTRRDLIRMSDLKFYADLLYTLDYGFDTIKGRQIDLLYKKYNVSFPHEGAYARTVRSALAVAIDNESLRKRSFMRPHVFQSVVLAIAAGQDRGDMVVDAKSHLPDGYVFDDSAVLTIEVLDAALTDPDDSPELASFIEACTVKTNVDAQRAIRFLHFHRALHPAPL